MPILEGQSGSSETYESTSSDDSIPEVNWERWPLGSTAREPTDQATTTNPVAVSNMDGAIGFRRSIRSIKNRLKSTERKEGCTCPSGECKWAGECFSPKQISRSSLSSHRRSSNDEKNYTRVGKNVSLLNQDFGPVQYLWKHFSLSNLGFHDPVQYPARSSCNDKNNY